MASSICPYTFNKSRTNKPILIKFGTEWFYEEFSSHIYAHWGWTSFSIALHGSIKTYFSLFRYTVRMLIAFGLFVTVMYGPLRTVVSPKCTWAPGIGCRIKYSNCLAPFSELTLTRLDFDAVNTNNWSFFSLHTMIHSYGTALWCHYICKKSLLVETKAIGLLELLVGV
jgi:hypothetical protein